MKKWKKCNNIYRRMTASGYDLVGVDVNQNQYLVKKNEIGKFWYASRAGTVACQGATLLELDAKIRGLK